MYKSRSNIHPPQVARRHVVYVGNFRVISEWTLDSAGPRTSKQKVLMRVLSSQIICDTRGIWKVMHIHLYNFTQ